MRITTHAAERYVERVAPAMSLEQARGAIAEATATVEVAADFECKLVKLGNGAKLVLDGATVVTVLPAPPRRRRRLGR